MRYEHAAAGQEQSGSGHRFDRDGDYLWWAKTPGFNPFKLLAVIAGFAIFPPLGVAALVWLIWSSRRHGGHWRHAHAMGCGRRGHMGRTGNTAFDEHREKVLSELEAERQAFAEHRAAERRKRDQEAFDAFQAKRREEGEKPSDAQE
jgi:Protein of unknown function (DUF2852)